MYAVMFIRKVLLIIFTIGNLTLGRKLPDDVVQIWFNVVGPYNESCLQKHNPDPSDLDALINRGFVPLHKGVMCYTHCLYESAEILQSNGEVHMENLMGLLSYMTPELTEMCSHEAEWYSGTDMCEKGYILGNCVIHALAE